MAAFLLPLGLRSIPEVLAGAYPVGYDSITAYVPFMRDWALGNIVQQFNPLIGGWVLYAILGVIYTTTRADPILIVKVAGPLIYGLLGLSEYIFARRVLAWGHQRSLLVVLISTSYFVSLRMSWDLLRNTLGMAFLFVTLTVGKNIKSNRTGMIFAGLLLLTSMIHLLSATLAISVSVLQAVISESGNLKRLASTIPGATLVGTSLLEIHSSSIPIITSGGPAVNSYGYLFVAYIFLPLIPLALLGARSLHIDSFKFWLLVCSLGIILGTTPLAVSSELVAPQRWAFLLCFPLSAYATEGVCRLRGVNLPMSYPGITLGKISVLLLLVLAGTYIALPASKAFIYYRFFAPTSMLQSTIPVEESPDVIASFHWLSDNIRPGSIVMTTDPMYGWARQYFSGNATILWFHSGTTLYEALQNTLERGHATIYTVWWAEGQGWYGQPTVPSGFTLLHQNGKFGVFLYLR